MTRVEILAKHCIVLLFYILTMKYILRCNIPYFSRIQRPYYKSLTKTCFCVPIKMRGIILALQHVQLFSSLHIFSSAFIIAQETSSKYNGRSSARDNHVLRYVFFLTFSSMLFFIRNRTGKKQPTEWLVSRIVSYLFVSLI